MVLKIFLTLIYFSFFSSFRQAYEDPTSYTVNVDVQTRQYATTNVNLVMTSLYKVIEKTGFTLNHANAELGTLYAERSDPYEGRATGFKKRLLAIKSFFQGQEVKEILYQVTELSAALNVFDNVTHVYVVFKSKIIDKNGRFKKAAKPIDPDFYNIFYNKLTLYLNPVSSAITEVSEF